MERVRNPRTTRKIILEAGFEEIYLKGFQASSVNNIIKKTRLTKGAFFHHFATKLKLGYTVVDETLREMTQLVWIDPLEKNEDPIQALEEMFLGRIEAFQDAPVILGCPLNNLAQEMSPIDEGFRQRVQQLFELWIGGFSDGLARGQGKNYISKQIDCDLTAFTLVSLMEGLFSLAKSSQDIKILKKGQQAFKTYLESLKP
jgi:TetR/AcrR family transcriptional regulator, transcriptional repressor for nem operon